MTSPALMSAAEELMGLGISLHTGLALVERVSHDLESISRAFTKLFLRELWEPFEEAGKPDDRWDELIAAVNSLRPLASEALLALFKQRMTDQLEVAFGKVIEHQAKRQITASIAPSPRDRCAASWAHTRAVEHNAAVWRELCEGDPSTKQDGG